MEKFKVIGSYLYRDDWHDIDIITADIETGWKLLQSAKEKKIRVQIVFMTEEEFNNIESILTFKNTAFSWHNGNFVFSDIYVDSDVLQFNNASLVKFKNSKVIFAEINKMKERGFKYER